MDEKADVLKRTANHPHDRMHPVEKERMRALVMTAGELER